ncbi:MAG: hypothetical protein U0S36_08090 [Candidatus Nanopelagicales bacterium]
MSTATQERLRLALPGAVVVAWFAASLGVWFLLRAPGALKTTEVVVVAGSGLVAFAVLYAVGVRRGGRDEAAAAGPLPARLPLSLSRGQLSALVAAGAVYYLGRTAGNLAPLVSVGWDTADPVCSLTRAYVARQESFVAGGDSSPLQSALNLVGVLQLCTIPLLVLAWGSLHRWARVIGVAAVSAFVVSWLLSGAVKGIADTLLVVGASALVWLLRPRSDGAPAYRRAAIVAALGAGGLLFVLAASTILGARVINPAACFAPTPPPGTGTSTGGSGGTGTGTGTAVTPVAVAQGRGTSVVLDYVTQGYSGLGASLTQEFVWTKGSGTSPGLARVLFFVPTDAEPYPVRAERATGWPALGKWQTLYPWVASDVTWVGAVLVVGLLGLGLGASWRRALVGPTGYLAGTWFATLATIAVYVPLNNQPVAATSSVIGLLTLGAVTVWVVVARRRDEQGDAVAEPGPVDARIR